MIDWLFTNALAAVALAMIAGVLIWFCRPSPAVRHALWLVVVLKLVSPTGLMLSVPLPIDNSRKVVTNDAPGTPSSDKANYLVKEELFTVVVTPRHGQSAEEAALAAVCQPEPAQPKRAASTESTVVPTASQFDYRMILFGFWLAGAAIISGWQIRETVRFARFTRKSGDPSPYLVAEVGMAAKRLGVKAPNVRVLRGLASPVLWCLWKPVLLWPAGLELRLKGEGRLAVLAHELAHLRRRDHWARRLEMFAAVLHWWNPLFWIARRKMRADAELACDAWATGQVDRRIYAEALLEVCSFHPRRRPAPAVGVIGEGRRAMQERLTMIMKERVPCRLKFGAKLIIALMGVAAIPAWTLGQAAAPAAPQGDPQVQAIEAQIQVLTEKLEAVKAAKKAEALNTATEKLEKAQVELRTRFIPLNKDHLLLRSQGGDVFLAEKPVAAAQGVKVIKAGEGGVKVIGADGKEIKDVKVVIVEGDSGQKTITATVVPPGATPNVKPLPATTQPLTVTNTDGKKIVVDVVAQRPYPTPTQATQARKVLWATTTTEAGNAITLSRATYKIGKDQASALASLLGSIKATVMETKVDGDTLTVTTTPEAQKTIGQIVGLMKGAGSTGNFELRVVPYVEGVPAVPATPAVPAAPGTPTAPKVPSTPKPASFEYKLAEPAEIHDFSIELNAKKLEELKKLGDTYRYAVPLNPSKTAAPTKP